MGRKARIVFVALVAGFMSVGAAAFAASFIGTSGPDTFAGTPGGDEVVGLGNNDNLSGGADRDVLLGGAENDTLTGGTGMDILIGGANQDTVNGNEPDGQIDFLFGGTGNDVINAIDGARDYVVCERGIDVANVDAIDVIIDPDECETVNVGP